MIDATISGDRLLARCDALAALSETEGALTRTYLSPQHAEANALVGGWMAEAGMTVRVDALGNLIGRRDGTTPGAPAVMIGSHLDTVRDAGRYDGMLGVLTGIEVVEALAEAGRTLPFAVEVVGFGDEEGTRFGTTLIGSLGVAGLLTPEILSVRDRDGVALGEALRAFGLDPALWTTAARHPGDLRAYLEVHIEQGPQLEALGEAVGVVTAIAGATRRAITLTGQAGHAGTVPMDARRDALAGAAEAILAVEAVARDHGVVATVGTVEAHPGAVNVIPGAARLTVDLRAAEDPARVAALADLDGRLTGVAQRRALALSMDTMHDSGATPCAPPLMDALSRAIADRGGAAPRLMSGAGHDAMAMTALAPVAMLFVRCAGGISHNPAEAITAADAGTAAAVLHDTLLLLAEDCP
ncbi:allantoate amidohydrolase [Roseospira marina]|uniref:Allantoate amidohydrolase n=1 Tax=Roseospira marina TaxID=140057 RepID=A0A5M6IDK4_9PROT|nr:allantoate amidohydrolase [Roseospira marina]KAA5606361.1 allantoate amidohydrolase [Roseospira marina]MBB4314240.1 hydantoinase/carbamoylase family amidase [Roseospira marina]MBB5087400.1 hydantoinase/carbamoylase family amidase [Roseospira marina]